MRRYSSSAASSFIGSTYSIEGIKVTVQEKVDETQYGAIYTCSDMANFKHIIKIFQSQDDESEKKILNEYNIQRSLSGFPNVAKIEGMLEIEKSYKILMEYCDVSLFNEYSRFLAKGFPTEKIVDIFCSVLSVIKVLHEQVVPVLYRDIRIENIAYKHGVWKISNFSSASTNQYLSFPDEAAKQKAQGDIQRNVTPCNRSPEMVDLNSGYPINEKTDIWSLGCFLFKLCNFKDAFPGGQINLIKTASYQYRPNWQIDEFLKHIIQECLQVDPRQRPTIQQLYHEFRTHYGIKEASFAIRFSKTPKINYDDYIEDVLNFQPPPSFEKSDESDIEMDSESKLIQDSEFETVNIDSNTFNQLFNFTDSSGEPSSTQGEIIDLSEVSTINIEFHHNAAKVEEEEDDIDESNNNELLSRRPLLLMRKVHEMNDEEVRAVIEEIKANPEFGEFALAYARQAGTNGAQFLRLLPDDTEYSKSRNFDEYLHMRRDFARNFPMFEGNFSLHDFTKEFKENPPKPGKPPVCLDVIYALLNLIDKYTAMLGDFIDVCPALIDDGRDLYQTACYISVKLIYFKIETHLVYSVVIESLNDFFNRIALALDNLGERDTFHSRPFDFKDYKAVVDLRAPKHKDNFSH